MTPRKFAARLGRWRHWEFWPGWLFYPPVVIYYLWLALKYRGAMLPTAANPGIFSGGMVGESKMATLRDLMNTSPEFTAEAELLAGSTPDERLASLREICARRNIPYPFILKPDLGQRGAGIKLIRNESQAAAYLKQTDAALLVQRFAAGPHEVGIFYYRFPGEPRGQIFSITEKVFPVVTGDGKSTVAELVWRDPRARFLAEKYLKRLGARAKRSPARRRNAQAGRGGQSRPRLHLSRWHAIFARRHWRSALMKFRGKLNGFFIGRYDIRFASEAGFARRKKISNHRIERRGGGSGEHLRCAEFLVVAPIARCSGNGIWSSPSARKIAGAAARR